MKKHQFEGQSKSQSLAHTGSTGCETAWRNDYSLIKQNKALARIGIANPFPQRCQSEHGHRRDEECQSVPFWQHVGQREARVFSLFRISGKVCPAPCPAASKSIKPSSSSCGFLPEIHTSNSDFFGVHLRWA
jgi:hypothetical protein